MIRPTSKIVHLQRSKSNQLQQVNVGYLSPNTVTQSESEQIFIIEWSTHISLNKVVNSIRNFKSNNLELYHMYGLIVILALGHC